MKELLRDELGFKGVTISDALNMKALTNTWSVEEIALRAYESGTDLLLYGAHLKEDVDELVRDQIPRAFTALKQAFSEGRFSLKELDRRVLSILNLKEKRLQTSSSDQVIDAESLALKRTLFREALTQKGVLHTSIKGYVAIHGTSEDWIVQKMREEGIPVICWDPRTKINLNFTRGWLVGVHKAQAASEEFGLGGHAKNVLERSSSVLLFCTPYALQAIPEHLAALIAYENDSEPRKQPGMP
jgi:beta-glucosidase-like glycosyl hydrolase